MYVTLIECKNHLNIDNSFTIDDTYISSLIEVCETAISNHIDRDLTEYSILPAPIKHSILLLISNLYANREPVSFGNPVQIPYTLEYLLSAYKSYEGRAA